MKYFFLLIAPLFSFLLVAQTQPLSVDEVVQMGIEQSKQLKIDVAKGNAAKARVAQLRASLLPVVSLNVGYSRLSDNVPAFIIPIPPEPKVFPQIVNQFSNQVSANYALFTGYRAKYTLESTELLAKATELDGEKNRTEVVYNLKNAYYTLYKLQQSRKLLVESRKQLEARLKDTQNFVNAGIATKNDELRVQLQISNLELSQIEIDNALLVNNYNLCLLLGLPATNEIQLADTIFAQRKIADVDTYIQQALGKRRDLAAAQTRREVSEKSVGIAKSAYYPTVTIGANYDYNNPNQRVFPQEETFTGTWAARIGLNYNLTNLYNVKNQLAEANANLEQTRLGIDQLGDGIKMEVNANYLGYIQAVQKIAVSENAVAQATENYRIQNNKFQNEIVSLTDLLDAQVQQLQTRINLLNARADTELAYHKLLKSVGE